MKAANKPLKHRTNLRFVLDSLDARRLVERYKPLGVEKWMK